MEEAHTFLMPSYYTDFSCKMGACRSACCVGWPISISMKNYFYLLGLDCDPALRHRIDCGVRVLPRPTEEEYAAISSRYDGDCYLRMQDGRCALHAELGEEVLPDVCCLYPRGIRVENGLFECSCANSCEAVVELLEAREAPLSFVKRRISQRIPPQAERTSHFETLGLEQEIRLYLISLMQDRTVSLPLRLLSLGETLKRMERILEHRDREALLTLLSTKPQIRGAEMLQITEEHLLFGLEIAEHMMELLDQRSKSIREYGERALRYFNSDTSPIVRYAVAERRFCMLFPKWESFFENLLVNHMFFSVFPFQDRPEGLRGEHVALCAVYALLRFLSIGVMAEHKERSVLIDVMAAAFRLIEHTEFDRLALQLLRRLNCTSEEQVRDLVML